MTRLLIEHSKTNYSSTSSNATVEEINCGSLQRIAAATEAMSTEYNSLLDKNRWLGRRYGEMSAEIRKLKRSNAALKGVITRNKNAK